jgi:hypothetical protein
MNGRLLRWRSAPTEFANDADGAAYRPGNTLYPVEFVDKQKWSNFIHAYLAQDG